MILGEEIKDAKMPRCFASDFHSLNINIWSFVFFNELLMSLEID